MDNMSKEEFFRQSEAAVKRMREMNMRSSVSQDKHKMPPAPSFVRVNSSNNTAKPKELIPDEKSENKENMMQGVKLQKNSGFGIPFLDMLKKDTDMAVIIGLLLLLLSENGDKTLLLALLYILM